MNISDKTFEYLYEYRQNDAKDNVEYFDSDFLG